MIIYAGGFEKFIKDHERLVFSICFSFSKNYFDAEDLTQETFISAYRYIGSFDGINAKAWISKIAVNKCKNYLKSSQRKVYPVEDEVFSSIPALEDSPADYIVKKEQSENLYELCNALKEPYRAVAVKYFCENMKLSEYSLQSGIGLKTLETRLYRAKKKLSKMWGECK
ncbi:MAG: sigma-70 family RNA polymerase sigma factor [Defluviitaleaceae bacterium]|nr:sigma-70 family RNA polymerase sigma factor [Defluviitaleaceae bacterium]